MFKHLFFNSSNRTIYKGDKTAASPVEACRPLITDEEARLIDRQEARIRQLEQEAKNNASLRFYMYGY